MEHILLQLGLQPTSAEVQPVLVREQPRVLVPCTEPPALA